MERMKNEQRHCYNTDNISKRKKGLMERELIDRERRGCAREIE